MPVRPSDIKSYLESVLGAEIRLKPASAIEVPFHIRDAYKLADLTLLMDGKSAPPLSMLLLLPAADHYPGAVALRKHVQQVQKATDRTVVYVSSSLSAAERRSLITNHFNFIQPGSQMFIPELAMDLREQVRRRRNDQEVSALTPAAQVILLDRLYEAWDSDRRYTSSAIMGDFNYSRVTRSKVIEQLLGLDIIQGLTSLYSFNGSPAEVFRKARQWMRTPVRRKVPVNGVPLVGDGVFLAGESALASYTLLAGPVPPVYGMTRNTFDLLLEGKAFKVADSVDDTKAWVEIWAYRSLREENGVADQASLLLSLEDCPDERVQMALDEIREEVKWLGSGD